MLSRTLLKSIRSSSSTTTFKVTSSSYAGARSSQSASNQQLLLSRSTINNQHQQLFRFSTVTPSSTSTSSSSSSSSPSTFVVDTNNNNNNNSNNDTNNNNNNNGQDEYYEKIYDDVNQLKYRMFSMLGFIQIGVLVGGIDLYAQTSDHSTIQNILVMGIGPLRNNLNNIAQMFISKGRVIRVVSYSTWGSPTAVREFTINKLVPGKNKHITSMDRQDKAFYLKLSSQVTHLIGSMNGNIINPNALSKILFAK
ncbi:hypothetical protein DFA_01011 [Cavenderia fasciculata]|uniref:Uncharacterized protein n=1 Tax=Cavenderia fasciculata TaxID=261658 RepID=F4PV20_CACFS|nr:uncharacterized protein DFA_01011 [Cavenderia fasciculata]EGG21136.1 hypothetical protein DFA_01011 [Cavenderia fasciculata]|eukprot:XP_004358986.1 hypothetical protein DFA_01011 [Cavenderia fasciculata]